MTTPVLAADAAIRAWSPAVDVLPPKTRSMTVLRRPETRRIARSAHRGTLPRTPHQSSRTKATPVPTTSPGSLNSRPSRLRRVVPSVVGPARTENRPQPRTVVTWVIVRTFAAAEQTHFARAMQSMALRPARAPSAVEAGELGGDLGQQLAQLGGLDDLEAATQAGDLAGQGAHVVAAELDLDAAVRPGGADPHPVAEDPAANGHGVGCRQGK